MKVVAFNGSPRKTGNTASSLAVVTGELEKAGISTELVQVGKETVSGCKNCYSCVKNQNLQCAIDTDPVNDWIAKMGEADGILLGSPVHFSGIAGTMKSFLDRAFFVISVNGGTLLRHKVGASVAAVRRSGGLPTMNGLNHYLLYSEMVIPCSNYWNVAHGMNPGEMRQDTEGVQILEVLGKNMAWLMQVIEAGKKAVPPPEKAGKILTNFVR